MNKLLQILIPQYNETDEVVKPLLDSIALQQGVDLNKVGVIIVNDGSDIKLSKELIESYPFEIIYHLNEHKGVSATRNKCLDLSTAEYVMFCDADDMFADVTGLWLIFDRINFVNPETHIKGFDTFNSTFIEETKFNDQLLFIDHNQDSTFVHGKVHRRQYLIDQKIRWDDSLTIHEDSYFNILCQSLTTPQQVVYCARPFYLWKWREESVCRHDPLYLNKTYTNMLDSNTALVKQFIKRGKFNEAVYFSTMMFYDCYYTLNADRWWTDEGKQYVEKTENRIKAYYNEFKHLIDQCPKEMVAQLITGLKARHTQEGVLFEKETYDHWYKRLFNQQ